MGGAVRAEESPRGEDGGGGEGRHAQAAPEGVRVCCRGVTSCPLLRVKHVVLPEKGTPCVFLRLLTA